MTIVAAAPSPPGSAAPSARKAIVPLAATAATVTATHVTFAGEDDPLAGAVDALDAAASTAPLGAPPAYETLAVVRAAPALVDYGTNTPPPAKSTPSASPTPPEALSPEPLLLPLNAAAAEAAAAPPPPSVPPSPPARESEFDARMAEQREGRQGQTPVSSSAGWTSSLPPPAREDAYDEWDDDETSEQHGEQHGCAGHELPEGVDVEVDGELLKQATLTRRLKAWWAFRRKQEEDDHERMPCWKQYTVLFVGSVFVSLCTVAVTTLFALIPPITQFFVVFSFSASVPGSVLLHFSARWLIRHLRKRRALARGRSVEGAHRRRFQQHPSWVESFPSFQGAARLKAAAAAEAEAEERRKALKRLRSAHLANHLVDAMQSLDDRRGDGFAASQQQATAGRGLRATMRGLVKVSALRALQASAAASSSGGAEDTGEVEDTGEEPHAEVGSEVEAALAAAEPTEPNAPAAGPTAQAPFKPGTVAPPRKRKPSMEPPPADSVAPRASQALAFGERAQSRGAAEKRGRRILSGGTPTSPPVIARI